MKKKIISSIVITSLMLLNSCSLFQKGPYEPFKSGHGFSLVEEGYGTTVNMQHYGNCWAMASSTVMESDLLVRSGVKYSFQPNDIVSLTYGGSIATEAEGLYSTDRSNAGSPVVQPIAATATNILHGYVTVDANDYSSCDIEVIQEHIRTGGALTCMMRTEPEEYWSFDEHTTYNNPDIQNAWETDHVVVIVGWDDDFPANQFSHKASRKGAWLVQNSWGKNWGEEGYFWMSYDTKLFGVCDISISDEYSEVLSYDASVCALAATDGGTATANVYDHAGTIGAIGTYTSSPNQTLTLEIYSGEFGELIYTEEQTFEYVGYHTIELDEPLDVEQYTVVIHYPEGAPVEGDSFELQSQVSGITVGYNATIDEGQSYILVNGEWIDMSTSGIEDSVEIITIGRAWNWVYGDINGHECVIPNNACIKVLYLL